MVAKSWLSLVFFFVMTLAVLIAMPTGSMQVVRPENLNNDLIRELFRGQLKNQNGTHELERIRIEFRDLDHDGLLEIIDVELQEFYHWAGEKHESDYVKTGSASHRTVLKLEGGVFKELDLPIIKVHPKSDDILEKQLVKLLPQGAMLRDFAPIPDTQKVLVIYIQDPVIDPEPIPDDLLICSGWVSGQAIRGVYHLALLEDGRIVNDTIIPDPSDWHWPVLRHIGLIFRHTKAVIHARFGGPKPMDDVDAQLFSKVRLMRLRDLNGDDLPHEFQLEVYVAACGYVQVLTAGYSAKQQKAMVYPILEGQAARYWHDNFHPDEQGRVHWQFQCGDHANDIDAKKTFEFDQAQDAYVLTSHSEAACEW